MALGIRSRLWSPPGSLQARRRWGCTQRNNLASKTVKNIVYRVLSKLAEITGQIGLGCTQGKAYLLWYSRPTVLVIDQRHLPEFLPGQVPLFCHKDVGISRSRPTVHRSERLSPLLAFRRFLRGNEIFEALLVLRDLSIALNQIAKILCIAWDNEAIAVLQDTGV